MFVSRTTGIRRRSMTKGAPAGRRLAGGPHDRPPAREHRRQRHDHLRDHDRRRRHGRGWGHCHTRRPARFVGGWKSGQAGRTSSSMVGPPTGARSQTEARAGLSIDLPVATPVSSHFDIAMRALQAGKHVLVTKPITADSEQAMQLIEAAEQRGLVLMVDHTFVYTGAVQTIKQMVEGGNLGQLYYYDSNRVNLGLFQRDVNVLWDLAVHDLAIMDYVLGQRPVAVAATGAAHVPGHQVNLAYLTCYFEGNLITHHHVNWLAPLKIRRTLIGGARQMIVYDDLEPSEKLKVYDKGVTLGDA